MPVAWCPVDQHFVTPRAWIKNCRGHNNVCAKFPRLVAVIAYLVQRFGYLLVYMFVVRYLVDQHFVTSGV